MILVDINLLLYAEDTLAPRHAIALRWWEQQLSGSDPVGLCWPVLSGYIRIATNPRIQRNPLTLAEAAAAIDSWFDQPCVRLLTPSEGHWPIFKRLLREGNAIGNLVSDAHIAALAIEHSCELQTTDVDFSRFRGLRWKNPLQ